MDTETLKHLPIALALVAAPVATLVAGWRFVAWLREMIKEEIRPLEHKIDKLERVIMCPDRECPRHYHPINKEKK